jgi:hypothetical protein
MSNGDSPETAPRWDVKHPDSLSTPPEIKTTKPLGRPLTLIICAAGYVFPGVGHILLKRWVRGLIFAVCVTMLFGLGLGMRGKLYDLNQIDQPLQIFAFFADIGVGLPYWYAARAGFGIGEMTAQTFDYGTTFLWVAGLLNYLIMLDAFDIAQGRKP